MHAAAAPYRPPAAPAHPLAAHPSCPAARAGLARRPPADPPTHEPPRRSRSPSPLAAPARWPQLPRRPSRAAAPAARATLPLAARPSRRHLLAAAAARLSQLAARPSRVLTTREPSPPPANPARTPQHPRRATRPAARPPSCPDHSRPPISPSGRPRQRSPSPGNPFSILYSFVIIIDKLLVVNSSLLLVNC